MNPITRRDLLRKAALASGAMLVASRTARAAGETSSGANPFAGAQVKSLAPLNPGLEGENHQSTVPPDTDHGNIEPFKYPFAFAHKKVSEAGWARQINIKDLGMAKDLAGVDMRLEPNGCRELHWHESGEWAYMLAGKARVTCIDFEGRAYVDDLGPGDLWYFPSGIPHSIQAPAEGDGCEFLIVFDDGSFSEYETFLISEWVARTPRDVLAKNMGVPVGELADLPKEEQFIFYAEPFLPLEEERRQASGAAGYSPTKFTFHLDTIQPAKVTKSGAVTIVDSKNFPISTTVATAIVTVKPGGMRELHWHPNADEWQYYVKGQGRMSLFAAANRARTMDVQAGDVGYVPISQGHYIENTGDEDLVFLEIFKSSYYADLSFNHWIKHTPRTLVQSHLRITPATYDAITSREEVIVPA